MKTGKVTYNVRDRIRKVTGAKRNFDCAALANLINSPGTQERVKHRDMYGYYGHWPRVKFGMNPAEGGVIDGRQVSVEPAFVTTSLTAEQDGTITHEAEFMDTAPGRSAMRLFAAKKGGFSSAIDSTKMGDLDYPKAFFGFDYVLSPNFSGNRPYAMTFDSIGADGVKELMDDADQHIALLDSYCQTMEQSLAEALEALARREQDVEVLLGMAASGKTPTLDSVGFERPRLAVPGHMFDSILGVSNTIKLEGFEAMPVEGEEKQVEVAAKALKNKFFGGR